MLIAGLHLADVRPSLDQFTLTIWPILIGVSAWFFALYLPTLRG
jgi:hypothetical protein